MQLKEDEERGRRLERGRVFFISYWLFGFKEKRFNPDLTDSFGSSLPDASLRTHSSSKGIGPPLDN